MHDRLESLQCSSILEDCHHIKLQALGTGRKLKPIMEEGAQSVQEQLVFALEREEIATYGRYRYSWHEKLY